MSKIARQLLVFLAALAASAVAAMPSYAASPAIWKANAHFDRPNPYDPSGCVVLKLDLRVTQTTAYVDYWARNTCFGFDYDHLTGSTALGSDQVSLGSLDTASLTNVGVTVSGAGYFQAFTFNLTWTRSEDVKVVHPTGGTGQVARVASASVSGSVLDLGGNNLFSGSDVTEAEIEQVLHTVG
jgi:hypothetical protein